MNDPIPMDNFSSFFNCESIFWVIIFFGGSIFVHELGHFLAAKRRKLFVPRFSVGFGPRIFSKTIGETEFCLSLLPFGGYVALPQLMEEKSIEGKYKIPQTAKPISSTDKIIVSAMGACFNIIFAFILAVVLWKIGIWRAQSTTNNIVGYVHSEIKLPDGTKISSPAREAGIEIGDEIIAIDGHKIRNFMDIIHGIALGKNRDQWGPLSTLTIVRKGEQKELTLHPVLIEQNARSKEFIRVIGIETFQELIISKIYKDSPAEQVGLRIGDKLCSVDGVPLFSYSQLNDILKNSPNVQLTIERSGKLITCAIESQSIPFIRPYLRLATADGVLELSPSFGEGNSIKDLCKDICELQLLSISSDFQSKYPELHTGSKVTSIHGQTVQNFSDALFIFQNAIDTPIEVTIDNIHLSLVAKEVKFIRAKNYNSLGVDLQEKQELCHENPLEQIIRSARLIFLTLGSLISPSSDIHLKNLMGPPGIIKTLNTLAIYDFRLLIWFVIVLNVNLAIFNLLPLPILDGGIIALVLLELLLRRKIAICVITSVQFIFMLLFFTIAIYISFFDVNRILGERAIEEKNLKQQQLIIDEQILWNGLNAHPN
jgi:RIP metalloprotease RseP